MKILYLKYIKKYKLIIKKIKFKYFKKNNNGSLTLAES